jgi:hypothetical protein
MTETHGDDRPGFVATEPEHCHDCCRIIWPGERCLLRIEQAVVGLVASGRQMPCD